MRQRIFPDPQSAIHYTLADMDVLIDRAMAEHIANFEASLRSAGEASSDPLVRPQPLSSRQGFT